jgi:hypothetical protein
VYIQKRIHIALVWPSFPHLTREQIGGVCSADRIQQIHRVLLALFLCSLFSDCFGFQVILEAALGVAIRGQAVRI